MMEQINGVKIPDFKVFQKVSDLIWFEGPLVSHFLSPNNEDYIFYWSDADKNERTDKWIITPVSEYIINQYINRQITLKDMMLKTINGIAFFADVDENNNYMNVYAFSIDSIDSDYLPEDDTYNDFEIVDYYSVLNLSKKNESGILEIKLSGESIKTGEMKFNQYSDTIDKMKTIVNGLTADYVESVMTANFKPNERTQSLRQMLQQKSSFDVLATAPGSFKIYLKPQSKQTHLISGNKEFTDEFADELLTLLKSGIGNNVNDFEHFENSYKQDVLEKYLSLAKFVKSNQINIDFLWYNAHTKYKNFNRISKDDGDKIIRNIVNFKTKPAEEIEKIGRFTMLNVKTGRFEFIDNGDENINYEGHYEGDNELLIIIKFDKTYKVRFGISYDENGKEKKSLKAFEEL